MEIIEKFGHVKLLKSDRGFGFIKSKTDDYFFKTNQAKNLLRVGDEVAFLAVNQGGKPLATSIRRVFTNAYRIRFVSRPKSHLHEGVEDYLVYIFNEIKKVDDDFIVKQIDFTKPIGLCNCVATLQDDNIYYAIRKNRLGHSRFVLNREPESTNSITVVLKKMEDYYSIIISYLGKKSGVEPYDERATCDDLHYWSHHAFIHGSEPVIEGSETRANPWVLNTPAICGVLARK